MGNIGGGEILVILLAALLILGPTRLPDAARQVGKAMAEFRKVTTGFQRELRSAIDTAAEPDPVPAAKLPEPPLETPPAETVTPAGAEGDPPPAGERF